MKTKRNAAVFMSSNKGFDAWRQAYKDFRSNITRQILDALSSIDLNLSVEIRNTYEEFESVEAFISYDERSAETALKWEFRCYVDRNSGDILKETNSPSGLSATSSEQLYNLDQTVQALKILNSLDWIAILDVDEPRQEDF